MKRIATAALIAWSAAVAAQEPPKPPPAPAKEPATPAAEKPVIEIEKSTKPADCVIKPVMTDEELRACGARITK
jgi:hypothetical protein